jgi:polyisoprenoid-binding protein YceI
MSADIEPASLVPPGTWVVQAARSRVGFDVRHLLVSKVHGRFRDVEGTISCDGDGVALINGRVAVSSIDTGDSRRDERLRAADFFDVAHHPSITLDAACPPAAPGRPPTVSGTMTLGGVSRPVQLRLDGPAAPAEASGELRIRAQGDVSRRDFGLDWDSAFAAGGLVINDRVALDVDVVLARSDQPR